MKRVMNDYERGYMDGRKAMAEKIYTELQRIINLGKQGEQETNEWKNGDIIRHGGILALVIRGRIAMKSYGKTFTIQYPDEWVKAEPNEIKQFLNELEKQFEQNPVDKIEPKFKVGDWVVYKHDICQIVKREEGCNKLVTTFGIEKELVNERNLSTAHLWTIRDAKDGDVFAASDGSIFIFKEVVDLRCKYYIALEVEDETIQVNDNFEHCWESVNGVSPASKEQRDLLFAKMKEAGYMWDAKKKELRNSNEFNC